MSREIIPHRAKARRKFALASSPSRALRVRRGVVAYDGLARGASVFNRRSVICCLPGLSDSFMLPIKGRPQACWRRCQAFLYLLLGMRSSERPGAVKGALKGAAKQSLDGEDRSEMIEKEGKEGRTRFGL
jgi:hypothetical protein